jgi:hypothetical protein
MSNPRELPARWSSPVVVPSINSSRFSVGAVRFLLVGDLPYFFGGMVCAVWPRANEVELLFHILIDRK